MKKHLSLSALILLLLLGQACKKNTGGGGANPGGGGHSTKKWLMKSIITKYDNSRFSHSVIKYDDTGRILQVGFGFSGIKDTFDLSVQSYYDYSYDSIGRLSGVKPNQGAGFKYVWLSPWSFQMLPDPFFPKSDGVGTYSFNANNHLELDTKISYWPPGTLTAGTETDGFSYGPGNAIESESAINDKNKVEELWAIVGTGPAKSIPNPLVGTSLQQRAVYFASPFGFVEIFDMLGDAWSNGAVEYYSYTSGTKKAVARSINSYKLDANGRVIEIDKAGNGNAPNFSGPWTNYEPVYITYEEH